MTMAGRQPAMSHSMGDLLSFPKQAAYQDLAQSGAIPSQRVADMPFYRNQLLDRDFPRFDLEECHYFARQDPFSVARQARGACPTVYPVEREYACRPSTPTVSPVRLPKPRMPLICPVISITSDNAESSVIYQDESDESDDRIVEEDEGSVEQSRIATGNLNYSANALDPFERFATPPKEYVTPARDCKRSLLAQPLAFDGNFFDTIPYIDQTDDINFAETSDGTRGKSGKVSGLRSSQKRADGQRTLSVAESNFERLDTRGDPNYSSIDTRSLFANKSTLSVKDATLESSFIVESRPNGFSRSQGVDNSAKRTLNVDERCEDKSDDVSNSEDCADESSSTINEDYTSSSRIDRDTGEGISTPKMYTIMPELHLDLSGLNSDDVSSDESKTEKCWKSPEEVRLGCGRVAALAKHFSKLGDAGLIRFKSTKLADSRQFLSEPDIMTSEKGNDRLRAPCRAKEYKSDSDLARQTDDDPRVARRNVILVDFETDGNFALEECRLHHCGAKRITIARIPSLNGGEEQRAVSNGTVKSSSLAMSENHNADIITKGTNQISLGAKKKNSQTKVEKRDTISAEMEDHDAAIGDGESQVLLEATGYENAPVQNVSLKDSYSKLSPEEQQVIVEQLEQFSNLDNADAPLFIPERNVEQVSLVSSTDDNNGASAFGNSTLQSTSTNREEPLPRKMSPVDTNDSHSQRTKKQDEAPDSSSSSSASSPPSVRSPSPSRSSVVLSLSNIAHRSLSAEDGRSSQLRQHRWRHPKSCFFVDISHSENRADDSIWKGPSTLPSASRVTRSGDGELNVLRVRIARPIYGSEDNLIDAATCEKTQQEAVERRRHGLAKLTRSCDSILNDKFLSDSHSVARTRSSEILREDVDSPRRESRDRLKSKFNEKTRWCRHHSLEELKLLRRGLEKKRDDTARSAASRIAEVRRRFGKSCDRLNLVDREEPVRGNCRRSLEEPKLSQRESHERDGRPTSPTMEARSRGPEFWNPPPMRLCKKHAESLDRLRRSALELSSCENDAERHHGLQIERKAQSELDISRRKSDSEREGWSFREIGSLRYDYRSALRKLPPHAITTRCVMRVKCARLDNLLFFSSTRPPPPPSTLA